MCFFLKELKLQTQCNIVHLKNTYTCTAQCDESQVGVRQRELGGSGLKKAGWEWDEESRLGVG